MFSGLVTGISLWRESALGNGALLVFPPIRQSFAAELRLKFAAIVREAFGDSVLNLRWQVLAYVFFGKMFNYSFSSFE